MRRPRGHLRTLGLVAAGMLAAAACDLPGGGETSQSRSLASDQSIKFPIGDDFTTLDPARVDSETDAQLGQNLFDGLLKFDGALNVVPDIAETLPAVTSDGLTYTFRLRRDVTFSNGDRVTARDVLYSWNRAAATQGPYAPNLSAIAGFNKLSSRPPAPDQLEQLLARNDPSVVMSGLAAPDDYTVVVRLAAPAGWFVSAIAMASTAGMIVSQKAIQQDPQRWWSKPSALIGTGPYRMSARTPGQSADFEAVPNWWGDPRPTVTRVHLDVVADPGSRETAYEQGRYDLNGFGGYGNFQIDDLVRIKGDPGLSTQLTLHPKVHTYWVTFNLSADPQRPARGPFADQNGPSARDLRTAFALAVDRAQLVDAVCRRVACMAATGGLISKGLRGYLGDNADPLARFDARRARSLLKGADPDGSRTRGLTYFYEPENPINRPTAEFLQAQWEANLGVHVDVKAAARAQFTRDRLAGRYVLARDGWQADYDHPQDWFDNLYGRVAGCPAVNCTSGYSTDQFNQLAAQADARPLSDALPIYRQMSQMLIDEVAYIPLYYTMGAYMVKPYVKGAGGNNFLDYTWNEYRVLQH